MAKFQFPAFVYSGICEDYTNPHNMPSSVDDSIEWIKTGKTVYLVKGWNPKGSSGTGAEVFESLRRFILQNKLEIPFPSQPFCCNPVGGRSHMGSSNSGEDKTMLYLMCWLARYFGWEIDHAVPKSKEGGHHITNLRLLPACVNKSMTNHGDLTNAQINADIQHYVKNYTEEQCSKRGLYEWFQLPEDNDTMTFFKSLKWEHFGLSGFENQDPAFRASIESMTNTQLRELAESRGFTMVPNS